MIEDSKNSVNIPAYQAEKAARLRRQTATYADMIVAAIGAGKTRPSLRSPSPSRRSLTARRSCRLAPPSNEVARNRATLASAPASGKGGSEHQFGRSAEQPRQSFALAVDPPKLSANYLLLFSQKLKRTENQSMRGPENGINELDKSSDSQERRSRPSSSLSRKPLPLDLTSRSLATAIYSGRSIFVEPSPLSKRLPRQGSFSAGGVRRKISAPKRVHRALTERLPPTQHISLSPIESLTLLGDPNSSKVHRAEAEEAQVVDNIVSAARLAESANSNDSTSEESGDEVNGKVDEVKSEKKEEKEEESYEDDFDTTGDEENEDKAMPSRFDNHTIASDGELFDMLHDISDQNLSSSSSPTVSTSAQMVAATTIQRHIRGRLVRQMYPRPYRDSTGDSDVHASEKKSLRASSRGKVGKKRETQVTTRRQQIPLSAQAHQERQNQDCTRRERFSRVEITNRPRPATAMSSPLLKVCKQVSQTKLSTGLSGRRHHSAATNNQNLSPSRSLPSGGHSAFELFSSNSAVTEFVKEPPDPEALKQIQALYAEGLQHQKENHFGLAIECYEKALAIPGGQSFASIHVNIGSALMAKNKFTEALESFEQAKRIQPNNIKAIYNHSLALLHQGRPQEAQRLVRVGAVCP
ncbi:unnamed protein product [Phytophthora fragariaefolia]|uniref:Unnamed protein product n=1 Tax=Phytophthora fragariaefolia TaxID=1490495 RepID=A0A9W6XBL3_9STRA|nr:unnamed protein product [Phytophthora fragariaefolia]